MIEYLYNAIRACSDTDIEIVAKITDVKVVFIVYACILSLYAEDELITSIQGIYDNEDGFWRFVIPADKTKGLKGRYFYSISRNNSNLSFKQPLYLV